MLAKKGGKGRQAFAQEDDDADDVEESVGKGKGKGKGKSGKGGKSAAVEEDEGTSPEFDAESMSTKMDVSIEKLRVSVAALVGRVGRVTPGQHDVIAPGLLVDC